MSHREPSQSEHFDRKIVQYFAHQAAADARGFSFLRGSCARVGLLIMFEHFDRLLNLRDRIAPDLAQEVRPIFEITLGIVLAIRLLDEDSRALSMERIRGHIHKFQNAILSLAIVHDDQ